jgi:predicted nucleotidyltransferase
VDAADQVALEAAQSLCGACLGALRLPTVSVILHGSLATGDFVPGRSDLDLLVVAGHELADDEIDALVSIVRTAELGGAAGIDLLVAAAKVCRAPSPHPPLELLVGRYLSGSPDFEVEARAEEFAGLVPELAMARQSGRALYGAAPGEVIGAVPREWIEERGRYWLSRWLTRWTARPRAAPTTWSSGVVRCADRAAGFG